jgi:hypothetical protein
MAAIFTCMVGAILGTVHLAFFFNSVSLVDRAFAVFSCAFVGCHNQAPFKKNL